MIASRAIRVLALASLALACVSTSASAQVSPGDIISSRNASKIQGLVSPGNFELVRRGTIAMKISPSEHLESPPPYKSATEKYSAQVSLTRDGELANYVAGLPFPQVDVNDAQAALKVMWNFALRPANADDADARGIEIESNRAGSAADVEHFSIGHLGFYKYIGRTEVAPTPTDPDVLKTGIALRAGAYPMLDPPELRGAGIVRERSVVPGVRHVYVIEARARNGSPLAPKVAIPKRILYVDSEGWFVTASDQYGLDGHLGKTVVVFHAYRDRPTINTNASWPFKRMFETALIDEDLTNGFSTAVYMRPDNDGDALYIDAGTIDRDFFTPARMVQAGH